MLASTRGVCVNQSWVVQRAETGGEAGEWDPASLFLILDLNGLGYELRHKTVEVFFELFELRRFFNVLGLEIHHALC